MPAQVLCHVCGQAESDTIAVADFSHSKNWNSVLNVYTGLVCLQVPVMYAKINPIFALYGGA